MGTKPTRKSPTPTPLVNEEKNTRTKKEIICSIIKKKTKEKFLTLNQNKYYQKINNLIK